MKNLFYTTIIFIVSAQLHQLIGQICPTSYTVTPQSSSNLDVAASIVLPSFGSNVYMKLYDSAGNLYLTGIDDITIPCRDEVYQLEAISSSGSTCSFPVQIDPSFSGNWNFGHFIRTNQPIQIEDANFNSSIALRSAQSVELKEDVCIPAGITSSITVFGSICESPITCPSPVNLDFDYNGVSSTSIGDVVCAEIYGSGINNLVTMQYSFSFNPNHFQAMSCSPGALPTYDCTNIFVDNTEGTISSLWLHPSLTPQPILNQTPLINICFEVITPLQTESVMEMSSIISPEFIFGDPNDPFFTFTVSNLCSMEGNLDLN